MPEPSQLTPLLWFGAFTLLPLLLVSATSYIKLSFVLSILRNALGIGQVPSGLIIAALAGVLSFHVMSPVGQQALAAATVPAAAIDWDRPLTGPSAKALWQALTAASTPLARFLGDNAGERERGLFSELAARGRDGPVEVDALSVLLPAFMITELKEAFQIGFLVLLPFLIVDMVVSSILLSLGMTMASPAVVSLPFKLLLFVLVDGWVVLSEALISGYA